MPPKAVTHAGGQKNAQLSAAPNQTLYCSNLPDKLQKADLRRSLYTLFSTYGPVLDVVALKSMKMRGQAHIVFRDVQASTQAMRALQSFDFFGKEMRISYAKTKSDTIAKLDGTFRIPTAAAPAAETSDLKQSIFNAPSSARATDEMTTTSKPAAEPGRAPQSEVMENGQKSPQGVKRPREEESDEDAPMEEDEESAMEESEEE